MGHAEEDDGGNVGDNWLEEVGFEVRAAASDEALNGESGQWRWWRISRPPPASASLPPPPPPPPPPLSFQHRSSHSGHVGLRMGQER
ncbi:Os06g0640400 [Oryza sativa Japonica Group]|uniref:Os06g0640400 protein n=1 Tax=Oryza sativa subsp. japonica TaxID=39947 RepID=A0A0P0WZA0_ORYSJ|nr:Os06g0640400 [Oryza sativa Japonica Group]